MSAPQLQHPSPHVTPVLRQLAVATVRELRRAGMSYRQIAWRFGVPAEERRGEVPRYVLPPDRLFGRSDEVQGREAGIAPQVFTRALDAVPLGLSLFGGSGQLIYSNRRLMQWLASAAIAAELQAEIRREVARAMAALREGGPGDAEEVTSRDLTVGGRPFRIRATRVELPPLSSGGALLVSLEDRQPEPPSEAALQERYGLSRQESRVALLLAEGKTNRQIAKELFISEHTARHHTQRVLEKMGARSRTEVAARLLQGAS